MATSTTSAAQQAAQAAAVNLASRNALLSSATKQDYQLQPVSTTFGNQIQQQIQNTGIVTHFDCMFSVTVNNAGTTSVNLQEGFPYTLINNLRFTDYTATDRVNTNGRALAMIQSVRHNKIWGASYTLKNGDFVNQQLAYPTAVAGGTLANGVTTTYNFWLRIPIAYESNSDLRGALVAQSYYGQAFLKFTPETANLAGNPDSPFSAGSAAGVITITNFLVNTLQCFLQPQTYQSGLPTQDFTTIYEINSWIQNSNLAVNQDCFINYPNARTIVAAHFFYYNGSAFTFATDMTSIKTIVSGNTILTNTYPQLTVLRLREMLMADPHQGYYYANHRAVPLSSYIYGQVQQAFKPNTVGATAYFHNTTESFYSSGSALPGVATQ